MKYCTGIGSRETPPDVLTLMTEIAKYLSDMGHILRSGRAGGADTAFELGASQADLFIPWKGFADENPLNPLHCVYVRGDDSYSREIAETLHPAWHMLSRGARALHTRNVNQILGKRADEGLDPSDFVIFYASVTKSGNIKGGTATAVNYARSLGIPTLNLIEGYTLQEVIDWVKGLTHE